MAKEQQQQQQQNTNMEQMWDKKKQCKNKLKYKY